MGAPVGHVKAGGRAKGTPNKVKGEFNAELRDMARRHGPEMLARLIHIANHGSSDAVKISAASIVIDRGYGKAVQAVSGEDGGPISHSMTVRFIGANSANSEDVMRVPVEVPKIGVNDDVHVKDGPSGSGSDRGKPSRPSFSRSFG